MIEAIVVYDVRTEDVEGQRRLREVAKICEGLGRRVQYSVFEIRCAAAQLIELTAALSRTIRPEDSVRVYRLPSGTLAIVEQLGMQLSLPDPDALIL